MKKPISKIMITVGGALLIAAAVAKMMEGKAVSVIGGADGPTSIFIAGKVSPGWMIPAAVVGVFVLAAGIVFLVRKK